MKFEIETERKTSSRAAISGCICMFGRFKLYRYSQLMLFSNEENSRLKGDSLVLLLVNARNNFRLNQKYFKVFKVGEIIVLRFMVVYKCVLTFHSSLVLVCTLFRSQRPVHTEKT